MILTLGGNVQTGAKFEDSALATSLRHIANNAGYEGAVIVCGVADAKGNVVRARLPVNLSIQSM